MSRAGRKRLAAAFDSAAYSVASAEEAHAHYGDPHPTPRERLTYWWRGFFAGLAGDSNILPLTKRFAGLLSRFSLIRINQDTKYEQ